ncbi:hypothetical protein GALMADRAFT_159155 [Galerina marginata CBS 339.88]|uniref:DUF6534 domain-containing protein n=1 Tax=Galerina marginata (strain CBS 339.88) TaxID=685588 RepID=A0A067SLD1_GALM3|nr:hypothetical protein GALMADRAFT_159155 [Galerina marginata CBS 339.88]
MSSLSSSELGRIAGPLLIGYLINWTLFGVLSVQVYLFHLAFPNDRLEYKALVYGSYVLETMQTLFFGYSAFKTFVTGFGDLEVMDRIDVLWFSVPVLSGLVAFLTQAFYAYRVTVLAQTKYLGGVIMLLALVQLAGAIATGAQAKNAHFWSNFITIEVYVTAALWEAGSAVCDIVIAVSMIYYLKRRDTGMKQTRILLARLIRLTIETGTMSAAVAVLSLILVFLPGHPTYYQASCSALAKMYSNSMMVAFNSRMTISPSNASLSTAISIPLSQVSRMRNMELGPMGTEVDFDVDFSRSSHYGGVSVVITREETTFPPKLRSVITMLEENLNDELENEGSKLPA